ncbi:MAG: siderophore-interacting protein [Mycobacterium sp.]
MPNVYGSVAVIVDVGPRIRRVVLDVPQVAELNMPGGADEAVGIYFPGPGQSSPPPMEYRDGEWGHFDLDDEPEGRNYSVRHRGPGPNQITCDFVLHQRGIASDWVRRARIGDRVLLDHARSWYRPESASDWQLLIADLAGLPALARILDELPRDATAAVIVEVADEADLDYLPVRPDIPIVTTIGTGNGHAPSRLTELAEAHSHPEGRGYCWFAGEAQTTREVRKHLRREYGWVAGQYDIVGYWRFDSETWDRKYEAVSDEVEAVYARALADGKGDKIASEEYDEALERVGL